MHYKGVVNFRAEAAGVQFERFAIHPEELHVEKVEIVAPDGRAINIDVYLSSVRSPDDGRWFAEELADLLLTRLAFEQMVSVSRLQHEGDSFTQIANDGTPDGNASVCKATHSSALFPRGRTQRLSATTITCLRLNLEEPTPDRKFELYDLFRWALTSQDPVGRFLSLYFILMALNKDDQSLVDDCIRRYHPHVPQSPSLNPKLQKKQMKLSENGEELIQETVYTKLRNQIGHWDGRAVLLRETRRDMNRWVDGLARIVKQAIEDCNRPNPWLHGDQTTELAEQDPFQFECWILSSLLGALPLEPQMPDHGVFGGSYLQDENDEGAAMKRVVFSVNARPVTISHVRDLRGVLDRNDAAIAVLISLEKPTGLMLSEAASAGFYEPTAQRGRLHPRLQLLTIADLLDGKPIDLPCVQHEMPNAQPQRELRTSR